MVEAINGTHLASLPSRREPAITVSCMTCHRGVTQPRSLQSVILAAYQAPGADSAEATYRSLRARFYGRATYDFGEVTLSDVADAATAAGKPQDAIRFNKLNEELLPTSGFAFRQLGFSYLAVKDSVNALAAW